MHVEEFKTLEAMLEDPLAWHYSLDVSTVAGIPAGRLYPVLVRLEKAGWLESRWEETGKEGPRRRVYRLTGAGQRCVYGVLAEQGRGKPKQLSRRRRSFGVPRPREGFA